MNNLTTIRELVTNPYARLSESLPRFEFEGKERWREWIEHIPTLNFKSEWAVKIIPPYGGALIRFVVSYKNKVLSVYLDVYDRLAICGAPYWEVYPENKDVWRCAMEDTKELMNLITQELEV